MRPQFYYTKNINKNKPNILQTESTSSKNLVKESKRPKTTTMNKRNKKETNNLMKNETSIYPEKKVRVPIFDRIPSH